MRVSCLAQIDEVSCQRKAQTADRNDRFMLAAFIKFSMMAAILEEALSKKLRELTSII
jgi:hypothetical protein